MDVHNRLGETVWHHAIRRDDGDDFLRVMVALYRQAKHIEGRQTIKFADGRNPLQVGGRSRATVLLHGCPNVPNID